MLAGRLFISRRAYKTAATQPLEGAQPRFRSTASLNTRPFTASTTLPIMKATNTEAQAFKALHIPGNPLFLANVHNEAVARVVAAMPACKALATASLSIALANKTEDSKLSLETQLTAVKSIAAVAREHKKPLTVDLQAGYDDRLEEAVTKMIERGVVGINLEDSDQKTGAVMEETTAVDRIKRALAAANAAGVPDFVVNARSDSFIRDGDLDGAIRRGKEYLAAGATTIYILGHSARECTRDEIAQMVDGLQGKVNVSLRLPRPGQPEPQLKREDMIEAGVARVSIGPQLFFAPQDKVESVASLVVGS